MKTILLTGFSPFGDYAENISEEVVQNFKTIGDYRVVSLVFSPKIFSDEAINAGKLIIAKAKEINASAIISLGMASEVRGFKIELVASNWVENEKYCLPEENKRVVDSRFLELELRYSTLNNWHFGKLWNEDDLINKLIELGLDIKPIRSNDAGNYCCNALMFRTLVALDEGDCQIPYLFLHIPCSEGAVKNMPRFDKTKDLMSLEKMGKILTAIVSGLK